MMNQQENTQSHSTVSREVLAAERTFLAWIRTSIALMGFGFVIVKFTIFLKEISAYLDNEHASSTGYSTMVGIAMVALGVVIALMAYYQYTRTKQLLIRQQYQSATFLPLFIASIILVGGGILTIYLIAFINH